MTGTDPPPRIAVRAEGAGDAALVRGIVIRAYADVPHSDGREHLMVERLRSTDAYLPELSLLAEVDGEAVGHVLLTRAFIRDGASATATLALAPLSVVPAHRARGVGSALVRAAHGRAARLGFGSVVLVGMPGYYRGFGYEPLGRYPIGLPFAVPAASRMILPLAPHALDGVAGTVDYPPGWLDH